MYFFSSKLLPGDYRFEYTLILKSLFFTIEKQKCSFFNFGVKFHFLSIFSKFGKNIAFTSIQYAHIRVPVNRFSAEYLL